MRGEVTAEILNELRKDRNQRNIDIASRLKVDPQYVSVVRQRNNLAPNEDQRKSVKISISKKSYDFICAEARNHNVSFSKIVDAMVVDAIVEDTQTPEM